MVGVLVIDMRKLSYPPIWLLFEQGRVQVAAGAPFAVGAGGCCGLACGQGPAMSDARPHRRLRLPRLRPWSRPLRILGGFAGRISPKRHSASAFPQVGRANSEQLPPKTAQKSRTMAKSAPISCETAQKLQVGFASR